MIIIRNTDLITLNIFWCSYPQRVSKLKATVRYMFHNPDDVRWFKVRNTHLHTCSIVKEFSIITRVSDVDDAACGSVDKMWSPGSCQGTRWYTWYGAFFYQKSKGYLSHSCIVGRDRMDQLIIFSFLFVFSLRGNEVHFQRGPSAAWHCVHELVQTHLPQVAGTSVSTSLCLTRNWLVLNLFINSECVWFSLHHGNEASLVQIFDNMDFCICLWLYI